MIAIWSSKAGGVNVWWPNNLVSPLTPMLIPQFTRPRSTFPIRHPSPIKSLLKADPRSIVAG
jgi:hypothetical protein